MNHPLPILMRRHEVVLMAEAIRRTGKSDKTLRKWSRNYGIGRQTSPKAPIEFSAPALEMVVHGEWGALELLRNGDRSNPKVRRFFDHLGISIAE